MLVLLEFAMVSDESGHGSGPVHPVPAGRRPDHAYKIGIVRREAMDIENEEIKPTGNEFFMWFFLVIGLPGIILASFWVNGFLGF
jgi:hypothetical protein